MIHKQIILMATTITSLIESGSSTCPNATAGDSDSQVATQGLWVTTPWFASNNETYWIPINNNMKSENKKKRKRLRAEETRILLQVFEQNPRPDAMVRNWLASCLCMTPRSIQIWFQNRRAKIKRDIQEAENQAQIQLLSVNMNPVYNQMRGQLWSFQLSENRAIEDDLQIQE